LQSCLREFKKSQRQHWHISLERHDIQYGLHGTFAAAVAYFTFGDNISQAARALLPGAQADRRLTMQ
jgi:hypothetical protein